jgi:tagatose 1,6-diphosphate aldolase
LKLESLLAANSTPPRDASAAAQAAQHEIDAIGEICEARRIPWVLLSGGATPEKFERVLDYAYAAAAGGFLAGRTIWLDAVRRHFPDRNAVAASLRKDGVAVLERLSELTEASANPWTAHFPVVSDIKQERFRAGLSALFSHAPAPATLRISDVRHQASGVRRCRSPQAKKSKSLHFRLPP